MKFNDLRNGLITQKYTKIKEECKSIPYTFKVERVEDNKELCNIHFQEGAIKEHGVNGVCGEDLIAMVIRRLERFQSTEFKCKENEKAIEKFQEGLMWLRKRTNDRELTGIEGTHIVDIESNIDFLYMDKSTNNKSFLELYENLKSKNIDVSYILGLYDKSLKGIDPYDDNLPSHIKGKILIECEKNVWYFLREIIRIPNQGTLNQFNINLANLLIIFSMKNNLNSIIELPRNTYEDMYPIDCMLLYELLTRRHNNNIMTHDIDCSKYRLDIIYNLMNTLPRYFGIIRIFDFNNINDSITHRITNCTLTISDSKVLSSNRKIFFDLNHTNNSDIILNDILKNSSNNEEKSITILGVPSNLITDEEKYLYELEQDALKFDLSWLSLSGKEIKNLIDMNKKSIFIHIIIGYKELGYSEQWFIDNCKMLNNDKQTIDKELLLKWNK